MKSLNYLVVLIFIGFNVIGCGPDDSAKTKLFETQRSALDKAKAVESTVQQQAQELQLSIEKQTQ